MLLLLPGPLGWLLMPLLVLLLLPVQKLQMAVDVSSSLEQQQQQQEEKACTQMWCQQQQLVLLQQPPLVLLMVVGVSSSGAQGLRLQAPWVAAVAASFNRAAARVETLVRSHQSLLGNASHELRSPLARLKMAVSMLEDAAPAQRERLRQEIHANIAELDALVEEVLLASRLDAAHDALQKEPVDLLALAAEEAARVQATVEAQGLDPGNALAGAGPGLIVRGDERLLRRAVRNLLENARRYGGGDVQVLVRLLARHDDPGHSAHPSLSNSASVVEVRICDRGPGVPEAWRERIFEPFLRLPGHAEHEGGVGLGLSLVRQIATRHGGQVRCEPREGGGSCFSLTLPG